MISENQEEQEFRDQVKNLERAAFPSYIERQFESNPKRSMRGYYMGMTKREYFAAKAMQGLLASDVIQEYVRDNTEWKTPEGTRHIAASAVWLADSLIKKLNEIKP